MEQPSSEEHLKLSHSLQTEYRTRATRVGIHEPFVLGKLMDIIDRHAEEIDDARKIKPQEAMQSRVSRADLISMAGSFLFGALEGASQGQRPIKEAVESGKLTTTAALTHQRIRNVFGRDQERYSPEEWKSIEDATKKMFPTLDEAREQARQEIEQEEIVHSNH